VFSNPHSPVENIQGDGFWIGINTKPKEVSTKKMTPPSKKRMMN